MTRLSRGWPILVALAVWGAACDADPESAASAPFEAALPDAPLLLLAFPDELGVVPIQGAVAVEPAPLLGEASDLHAATRASAGLVNRSLRAMTAPVQRVRDGLRPTRTGADRVIWEGTLADDPDEHRLVVERTADGRFEYRLTSRDHLAPDAPWRVRVVGSTAPAPSARGRGRGAVWVDLDADRLPDSLGKVLALWSDVDGRREVDVSFFRATPDARVVPPRTLRFVYGQGPLAGRIAFGPQHVNVHDRPDRPELEDVTVLSRWTARGAGRTDVTARGGDLRRDGVAVMVRSECWGPPPDFSVVFAATFARRVGQDALSPIAREGAPDACAFPNPELAAVPPVEAEPTASSGAR